MKNMLLNRFLVLAFGLLFSTVGFSQGWRWSWMISGGGPFSQAGNYVTGLAVMPNDSFIVQTNHPDGIANYYFFEASDDGLGASSSNGAFWPENGDFDHFSTDLLGLGADSLLVLEHKTPTSGGKSELFLTLYQYNFGALPAQIRYEMKWHKLLFDDPTRSVSDGKIIRTADGGYAILARTWQAGASWLDKKPMLIKLDAAFNVLWTNILDIQFAIRKDNFVEAPDGGFWFVAHQSLDAVLVKASPTGLIEWTKPLFSDQAREVHTQLLKTADGNLVVAHGLKSSWAPCGLTKFDPAGNVLWSKNLPNMDVISLLEHPNGDLSIVANVSNGTLGDHSFFKILILKTDSDGDPIWERTIGKPLRKDSALVAQLLPDGSFLIGGQTSNDIDPGHALLIKTDPNGWVYPGLITGNVFDDLNVDCSENAGDLLIENLKITAFRDSAHIFYGTTDAAGNYRIEADTGNFVVSLALPSPYWAVCANDVAVHLDYIDSAEVDFALSAAIDCLYLTVEIATNFLRPCDTARFHGHYCNYGTVAATDATVEVALDPNLSFVDASISPISVVGGVVTLPLGTIQPFECGDFWIDAQVECDSTLGTTACVDAHIFPDSSCLPPFANWSGALIELTGKCEGDSLKFKLKNIGSGNSSQLEYIVIEDAVLLRTGSFQLDQGFSMEIVEATSGATFHVLSEQEPNAPTFGQPIFGIENCADGDPVSLGFLNQFSENDAAPFVAEFCQIVVGSFDPNDKQAFPMGFGAEKNIFADTELEYLIRFQNTGSDTAFRVILIDSLSKKLDPATVRLGASSHPCQLEIEGDGVLRFTFSGIQLPNDDVNEAASNGFVAFSIRQKAGNAPGEIIKNQAGIYFDYNPPVITNWVDRTIHAPFFEVTSFSKEPTAPTVNWTAFPNPFADEIRFEIETEKAEKARLEVFSTDGKMVSSQPFSENTAVLKRQGLAEGAYFFSIKTEKGERLASGTILAK